MALKTGAWALVLLGLAPPLGAQGSPLQWPVPPPGPPRETVFPHVLAGVPELARALAAGAVPLDARGMRPYLEGHLPGAVPAWAPGAAEAGLDGVRERLAGSGISGRETVVVYGGDREGREDRDGRERTARLYWLLRRAGCAEVLVLDGGIAAWRAAGREIETGPPRRPAAPAFHPTAPIAHGEAAADAGWIAATLARGGVQLLDTRDARGWERWETPPTFAAGHIPYALPFDPRALLPESGGWPEPAEVRRRLAGLGPRPGDPVPPGSTFVLYGEGAGDPRPALGYLLLTLAGFDARVFPGGWTEWTASGDRPAVRVLAAAELAALLRREDPELTGRPQHGLLLLDLREARDFRIGHLPGARSLPFDRFAAELDSTVAAGWPGASRSTLPLVLYCYGTECVRSRKAGAEAARLGYRNLLWFRGGVREWRDAGYPLPPATPAASPPSRPSRPERGSPAGGGARP